ncbi:hypothetical protein [Mycolicibacterium mageritense]
MTSDLEYTLRTTRHGIAWVDDSVSDGSYSLTEGISAACERSCEITSFLYACGAPHKQWRHWAALSAFGLLLTAGEVATDRDDLARAIQYGVLAGEWQLVAALSDVEPPRFERYAEHVVWTLAVGRTSIESPPTIEDTADVWWSFGNAVIERHSRAAVLALDTIADVHMVTVGAGWTRFLPWTHPLFDLEAGAGAAIARIRGLVTEKDFPESIRHYLEPGLAHGEPTRLYPGEWPQPSVIAPSPS